MNAWARRSLAVTLGVAAVAVTAAAAAGVASASEDPTEGFPSTQSPLQALQTGPATLDNALYSGTDAANGENRPDGADGTESRIPGADPRFVEGPAGGLLVNGPFK